MSSKRYTDEFKVEAAKQVIDQGRDVRAVAAIQRAEGDREVGGEAHGAIGGEGHVPIVPHGLSAADGGRERSRAPGPEFTAPALP